eukprot:m.266169 g.266169  ORF g.266169 m.266169 type:complete len:51 (+) comp26764_c5_seq1:102-254(+)
MERPMQDAGSCCQRAGACSVQSIPALEQFHSCLPTYQFAHKYYRPADSLS